jgi:hypothetical protein
MEKAVPLTKLLLVGLLGSLVLGAWTSPAQGAGLSPSAAKQAARAAVRADASYKRIDSPFGLKLRSCTVRAAVASCLLFRSAPQPCRLNGPLVAGRSCTNVVAHRAWTVEIERGPNGPQASIVRIDDVTGKFEPRDPASSAKRR